MLIRFIKHGGGTLFIMTAEQNGKPGDGIKRIEDIQDAPEQGAPDVWCKLFWVENGELISVRIQGTADENFERLRSEELKAALEYEKAQLRQRQGRPTIPVQRGKGAP